MKVELIADALLRFKKTGNRSAAKRLLNNARSKLTKEQALKLRGIIRNG